MNQEALLKRLQQIEAQEEGLFKERRRIISQLTAGVSTTGQREKLSEADKAKLLNNRDKTLIRRHVQK